MIRCVKIVLLYHIHRGPKSSIVTAFSGTEGYYRGFSAVIVHPPMEAIKDYGGGKDYGEAVRCSD